MNKLIWHQLCDNLGGTNVVSNITQAKAVEYSFAFKNDNELANSNIQFLIKEYYLRVVNKNILCNKVQAIYERAKVTKRITAEVMRNDKFYPDNLFWSNHKEIKLNAIWNDYIYVVLVPIDAHPTVVQERSEQKLPSRICGRLVYYNSPTANYLWNF